MQQVYDGYQAEYGDPASQGDQAAGGSEAPPDPLAPGGDASITPNTISVTWCVAW